MTKTNKWQTIKDRFQHLPVAYTGLALGVGGLGNCLALLLGQNWKWISYITISFVIVILIAMLLKNIFHPKVLLWEIKEPMMVSLLPTFSMSLMLIAGFISGFDVNNKISANQIIGSILMIMALIIQFILIVFFGISLIKNHVKNKNNPMYGSYFVPTVGLITACTVAPKFTLLPNEIFQAIWFLGFGLYLISFPIVTWAILFKAKCDIARFPSIAVWFAPTNLSPAGFINVFLKQELAYYPKAFLNTIFLFTTICGFVFSIILYLYIIKIMTSFKFNPIFCSITFPCAIGSTSMILTSKYYNKLYGSSNNNDFLLNCEWFFGIVGIIFTIISTILITYILIRMLIIGWKILFTNHKDNEKHIVYKQA